MALTNKNAVLIFLGPRDDGKHGERCSYGITVEYGVVCHIGSCYFNHLTEYVNLTQTEMDQLDKALYVLNEIGCLSKDFLIDKKNKFTAEQITNITDILNELQPLGFKLSTIKIDLCHEKNPNQDNTYIRCPISRLFNVITEALSKESTVDKTQFYQIDPKIKQVLEDLSQALQPFATNEIDPAKQCMTQIEALANQTITPDDFRYLCNKTVKTSKKQTIDDAVVNAIVYVVRTFLRVFDILYASVSGTQKKNDDLTRFPFFTYRPHQEITRRYQKALEKLEALNLYEDIKKER